MELEDGKGCFPLKLGSYVSLGVCVSAVCHLAIARRGILGCWGVLLEERWD